MNRFLKLSAAIMAASGALFLATSGGTAAAMQPAAYTMAATGSSTTTTILAAPAGLHAVPAVRKATLSWYAVSGASVYELRINPVSGSATTRFDRVITARSAIVTLSPGRYVADVRAGRSASGVTGHWSALLYFTVLAPAPPALTGAQRAIAYAQSKIGCPYLYGGTGPCHPGFDCSGLVMMSWRAGGISLPRTTYEMWGALRHLSRSQLVPGDLVFSNGFGHVMLYIGSGYVIQAPHTGAFVERTPLAYVSPVGYAAP